MVHPQADDPLLVLFVRPRDTFASEPPPPAIGPVEELLEDGVRHGRAVLAALVGQVARQGHYRITPAERRALIRAFAVVTAAGDLLGRHRALAYAERHRPETFATTHHAERVYVAGTPFGRDTFAAAGGGLPLFRPIEALRYLLSLAPRLGVDPRRWLGAVERHAMTLARATEVTVLAKVQRAVARNLEQTPEPAQPPPPPSGTPAPQRMPPGGWGHSPLSGVEAVHRALVESGVADPDGSYSEMVFRTNALDALNTGFDRQMADPDLQELFPAWVYKTAGDDRVGKDHRPKDGKYFPASVTFAEARGPRPFNCRCTRIPITAERWRKLEAAGAKLETTW